MRTVFKILSVDELNNGIYEVKLALTEHMRFATRSSIGLIRLGKLMNKRANYDQAIRFYYLVLNERSLLPLGYEARNTGIIYNDLEEIYRSKNEFQQANENYQKSIEIKEKYFSTENHPTISATLNNIGVNYFDQNQYDQALVYYEKALKNDLNSPEQELTHISTYYANIGNVYIKKTLDIRLASLPADHPSIAEIYSNIGCVLCDQGNYEEAYKMMELALNISLKTFPEEHPIIIKRRENLALISQHRYLFCIK